MIWTTEYLQRVALEAEIEIARETKCIIDRFSLGVEKNISEYTLPDFIQDIRRITWKGFRLDPISHFETEFWPFPIETLGDGVFDPIAFGVDEFDISQVILTQGTAGSRPHGYYYSTYGENVIKFNGPANETIPQNPFSLWGENISETVIIEFYRVPDGVNFQIPRYIRRRTIKAYVMAKAFQKEGVGQNLKAAKYWINKYMILLQRAKKIIDGVYAAQIREYQEYSDYATKVPNRNYRLPWNWETINVEDEYNYD